MELSNKKVFKFYFAVYAYSSVSWRFWVDRYWKFAIMVCSILSLRILHNFVLGYEGIRHSNGEGLTSNDSK